MPSMKKPGGGNGYTKRQRKVRVVRRALASDQTGAKLAARSARILSRPNGAAILRTARKRGPLPRVVSGSGRKKHR